MNQDIFVSIIKELKDSHQEKVKRLEAKVKAYELFKQFYFPRNIGLRDHRNHLIDTIRQYIFEAEQDDKYVILECINIFNDCMPKINDFFGDFFWTLRGCKNSHDLVQDISYDFAVNIILEQTLFDKIYLLLGEEFCTNDTFDEYHFPNFEKYVAGKNRKYRRKMFQYCKDDDKKYLTDYFTKNNIEI